ncbi:MAG: malonyl-CoA decarboxylase [Beijerinckiaceae bacterium]|nr:malonyl-CoA decarboxylase [Beijerinckiaceae bacterium]
MPTAFFSDLLTSISDRGRQMLGLADQPLDQDALVSGLVDLCERVLSGRGEASGAALAREVLNRYKLLGPDGQREFFAELAEKFGPDQNKLAAASLAWSHMPTPENAADLHFAAEARRQELFRRLNRAPGGTAALVSMREDLLRAMARQPDLKIIDRDYSHLLNSWFNRGFLELRHINWSSPASVLEKIIRYEAVHQIKDWDDLRRRIDPPDRRCYGFFHPALTDEPLIFVEVAITPDIPDAVQPLLAEHRKAVKLRDARTAVFYSISNCQDGLAGISFGNFLIKQVLEELRRELPNLEQFVTLSPVPGFMTWLNTQAMPHLGDVERKLLAQLADDDWVLDENSAGQLKPVLEALAALYLTGIRTSNGRARDPVARFHLGNGARLERINWLGDKSAKGLRESAGIMVNYLYDLGEIEKNHEAYANKAEVVASSQVKKLVRSNHKDLAAAIRDAAMPVILKENRREAASEPVPHTRKNHTQEMAQDIQAAPEVTPDKQALPTKNMEKTAR